MTTLADRFRQFAELECRGVSPLYETLALAAAESPEILAIASHARAGQPAPNMLLGAVHYLLYEEREHPLAAYYPDLSASPEPPAEAAEALADFCHEHTEALIGLCSTQRVQTNEVGRCALVMPAFAEVARMVDSAPLALIEIGASAGLNLLWDRYAYAYETENGSVTVGDAELTLHCEVGRLPPLPENMPAIASRVGIDVNPLDVLDDDAMRWLRALIWPDHPTRLARFEQAVAVARRAPPPLLAGDAVELLPALIAEVPEEHALCLFHTHTTYQFSDEGRNRYRTFLLETAHERDFYEVAIEWFRGSPNPTLKLLSVQGGKITDEVKAHVSPHGEWMQWF